MNRSPVLEAICLCAFQMPVLRLWLRKEEIYINPGLVLGFFVIVQQQFQEAS